MSRKNLGGHRQADGYPDASDREEQLGRILAEYADRVNAGEQVQTDEILDAHPDLAGELAVAFEGLEALRPSRDDSNEPLGTLGDYILCRQIGRGGMGVVYEAWENSMDRAVALKVLPAGVAADTRASARFLREAQTAGKLSHPNVVPVYFTGVKEQTPFYAMEYVEGETLAQILAKIKDAEPEAETPFGAKDEVAYFGNMAKAFADVADGLQHAHSKGVIHRDIKPSNLILDGEGRLRILDFGLARLEGQESLTLSGDFVGTPLYMSPEQARRKKIPVDHRTDVYSLGATMYEAVCGRPPFLGKDHAETLSQIIERDPVEPRRINQCVPKDLETIVLKCLRKDSGDRYGTAEALGQDLRRFVRGDAVEARPQPRLHTLTRRLVRYRVWIAIATLAVAVISLTLFLVASSWRAADLARQRQYDRLLTEAITSIELGFESIPGEPDEGGRLSLGLIDPERLRGWFELSAYRKSVYESAIERLTDATRILPARPEAWVQLSRGHLALGNVEAADSALDRALQTSARFVPALMHKTRQVRLQAPVGSERLLPERLLSAARAEWEQLWIESHLAALDSDWEETERLYGKLLEHATPEPYHGFTLEHFLKRARICVRLDRMHAALEDFLAARRLAPDVITTHLLVAGQYYRLELVEDAHRTLDRVLARFQSPGAIWSVTDLCLVHGDHRYAMSLVESLPEPTRRRVKAKLLRRLGRFEEAVTAARKALSTGARTPELYFELAEALIQLQRIAEAEKELRQGLVVFPTDPQLSSTLERRIAYYRGRFDELLQRENSKPERDRNLMTVAWSEYRLGRFDEALRSANRRITKSPRDSGAYGDRAFMKSRMGDIPGAVSDAVESLLLSRGANPWALRLLREHYSSATRKRLAPYWNRLDLAFRNADARGLDRPGQIGFRALIALYREHPDLKEALVLAHRAASAARISQHDRSAVIETPSLPDSPEALSRLGEVHFVRGEVAEAVRVVERALTLRGCHRYLGEQLVAYRQALHPDMASCTSIDALVDNVATMTEKRRLQEIRKCLDRERPTLAAYLDARLLEQAGDFAHANARLESILNAPEIVDEAALLRHARLLYAEGRTVEAIRKVEAHLLEHDEASSRAWETWLALATSEPDWSPDALLDSSVLKSVTAADNETTPRATGDVAWVLREIRDNGVIRINCGRRRYKDTKGREWASDRFFDGGVVGWRFVPPVAGTDDPWLFATLRPFEQDFWLRPGYRIPLPVGVYDVTLFFYEPGLTPYPCRLSIEIEGELLEPSYEIGAEGIRVAQRKAYRVAVEDGSLDIVLRAKNRVSVVSAIEVARVGRDPDD